MLLPPDGIVPPLPLYLPPPVSLSVSANDDDRFPQWSFQETLDLLNIRAELEKGSSQTKRNKMIWEVISVKMKERGYRRSAEQCKCEWMNVVNRYKGKDASELDNGRQYPVFDELHAIITERAKTMDELLLESESGATPKKKLRKSLLLDRSSEDFFDDEDEEDKDSEDERIILKFKKRKSDRERQRATAGKFRANSMQEVLEDFFQQQQRIEMGWREAMERREEERRLREREFRNVVANMENERIMRDLRWREEEEQRQATEEARAENRDALFSAILKQLAGEEL